MRILHAMPVYAPAWQFGGPVLSVSRLCEGLAQQGVDTDIVVVGIHLYRTEEERTAQAERLVEIFAGERSPVFLSGDFNSEPDSPVMELLWREWSKRWRTCPGPRG